MAKQRFFGSGAGANLGHGRGRAAGQSAGPPRPHPGRGGPAKHFGKPLPRAGVERPLQQESKPQRAGKEPHARRPPPASPDVDLIYGFHAVREALRSPNRKKLRLFATAAAAEKLAADIAAAGLEPEIVAIQDIVRRLGSGDAVHQGLLLEARPLSPIEITDLPADGLVLVLDQITDPHNVGAILRTAAAFGVDALITTERHAPAFSGIVAKSASGGLEHVGLVRVVNLARALEELGDRDYLRVGLDSGGPVSFEDVSLRRPLALVLGAEGKGLRRLSRENCDVLARLDMPGKVKSLNVSNACTAALAISRLKLAR